MNPSVTATDVLALSGFVLAVTGAALSPWPFLALLVAAGMFLALYVVIDRRTPPPEPKP